MYTGFLFKMVLDYFVALLADAELGKNIVQQVIRSDFAGVFAHVKQAAADVGSEPVTG